MTADRFTFQRECAAKAEGRVLNVGCKEDPAHLKLDFGEKVTNLDRNDYDEDKWIHNQEKVAIPVDVVHDALVTPWPFEDDEFELVILGDILEDLPDDGCQIVVLDEARRVAKTLCITTPEDTPERDAHHQTTTTREKLKVWLEVTGWRIKELQIVDYGFVPRGHFITAVRVV